MASKGEGGSLRRRTDRLTGTAPLPSAMAGPDSGERVAGQRRAAIDAGIRAGLADAEAGRVLRLEDVRSDILKDISLDD